VSGLIRDPLARGNLMSNDGQNVNNDVEATVSRISITSIKHNALDSEALDIADTLSTILFTSMPND